MESEQSGSVSQEEDGGADRRQSERYPVEGWAEIMVMDGMMFLRGQIADIGSAGCYIATRADMGLKPGVHVTMIFRVRGVEFRPEGITRVVQPGKGAGFSFVRVNSKLRAQLDALIDVLNQSR
nr:PilZ domain-containing protein [Granulicella arctica]